MTPAEGEPSAILACALAAAGHGDVASLVVSAGPRQTEQAALIVGPLQERGIAVLIERDDELARKLGADGVMVAAGVAEARARLGANAIVGALAASRHEAMTAAEDGADVVGFRDLRLIAWWSEVATLPALCLVPGLAAAGADFLRPVDTMWQSPEAAALAAGGAVA